MMNNQHHENQTDPQNDTGPLMDVYNPQPPQPEQPARFYWQEPWREAEAIPADAAIQAAFEN